MSKIALKMTEEMQGNWKHGQTFHPYSTKITPTGKLPAQRIRKIKISAVKAGISAYKAEIGQKSDRIREVTVTDIVEYNKVSPLERLFILCPILEIKINPRYH